MGGGQTVPSPGWLARAALATCDATRIAIRAAELGVTLDTLVVTADSVDDDHGLFGIDKSVPAGSLSLLTRVTIGAAGVAEQTLREIIDCAVTHSPVADGCRRARRLQRSRSRSPDRVSSKRNILVPAHV